jgi:hypothetical protein
MTSPVESPEMVDTMVLVLASMTTVKASRDPATQVMHQTSLDLLRRLPVVRVSAIAWGLARQFAPAREFHRLPGNSFNDANFRASPPRCLLIRPVIASFSNYRAKPCAGVAITLATLIIWHFW